MDYDSDEQSLTAHPREENKIQVKINKEDSSEDKDTSKDDEEEFKKSKRSSFLTFNKYHYLVLSCVCLVRNFKKAVKF